MRRRVTTVAAIALLVPFLLSSLTWTAILYYWHLKTRRALDVLDACGGAAANLDLDRTKTVLGLRDAGCRAIPLVISTMEPGNQKTRIHFLQGTLKVATPDGALCRRAADAFAFLDKNRIDPEDSPQTQREKVQRIRAWWLAEGKHYHRWWRVWSANCPLED